jgi:phosphate starvation-inducible protein PhoH
MADEKTTIELTLDERQTHTLFGNHDENLRAIEDAFGVDFLARQRDLRLRRGGEPRQRSACSATCSS